MSRPFPIAGFSPRPALTLLAALLILVTGAAGDVFYLKGGGRISGELAERKDGQLNIRTSGGSIKVAESAVERIEASDSFFAEYDKRVATSADNAAEQTQLAAWCDERGLKAESRKHLQRALSLDGDYEPARRMSGYVRVNGLWVDGRTQGGIRTVEETKAEPQEDPARLLQEVRIQWQRRIRAIYLTYLISTDEKSLEDGRRMILEINDAVAILPLTQVLSAGIEPARRLLVEALARFDQDEATLNLAVLGLADSSARVRESACAAILRRNDPRVVPQYRRALKSDRESLIRHAAEGLTKLQAREAIPDLIQALKIDRTKAVQVPIATFYRDLPREYASEPLVYTRHSSGNVIMGQPIIGVSSPAEGVDNIWQNRRVTVFRTEVLEALKALTGRNFGFEPDEWTSWYKEQNP